MKGLTLVLSFVLLLMSVIPGEATFAPPLGVRFIACHRGGGILKKGHPCGYYQTNTGIWNLVGFGQKDQKYCKDEACSNVGGLEDIVTFLPEGTHIVLIATMSAVDVHGNEFVVEVSDTSVIRTDGVPVNKWHIDVESVFPDTANPFTRGMKVIIASTTLEADMSFPNPALAFNKKYMPPNWKPKFARGDAFLVTTCDLTMGEEDGQDDHVNTGPRAMTVMAFAPGTFKRDSDGNLLIDQVDGIGGVLQTPSEPFIQRSVHDFGVISLSGAPVTVVAAYAFDGSKNTCSQPPPGWFDGPDGGTRNGGINRTVRTAFTDRVGETALPITFSLCEGEPKRYSTGAAVGYVISDQGAPTASVYMQ